MAVYPQFLKKNHAVFKGYLGFDKIVWMPIVKLYMLLFWAVDRQGSKPPQFVNWLCRLAENFGIVLFRLYQAAFHFNNTTCLNVIKKN